MVCREASPWLCSCSPFTAVRSSKLDRIFRPSISFRINSQGRTTCFSGPTGRGPVLPLDITRHWIEAQTYSPSSLGGFVVVSYNILADKNASKHRDMYQNISSTNMKWDR